MLLTGIYSTNIINQPPYQPRYCLLAPEVLYYSVSTATLPTQGICLASTITPATLPSNTSVSTATLLPKDIVK